MPWPERTVPRTPMRMLVAGVWTLALLLTACVPAVREETVEAGFDGTRTVRLRGNLLPASRTSAGDLELNVERTVRPTRPDVYALLVESYIDGLRIREEAPLVVTFGSDTLRLLRDGRTRSWSPVAPGVREQARYPAEEADLRRLAGGRGVEISIRGAAWTERRSLSDRNLRAIREFLAARDSTAPAAVAR